MSLDVSVMNHYALVDWDRDGDTTGTAEDVTADVLTPPSGPGFTSMWGRDQPRALSPLVVPEGDCELNNEEGTYSNLYTGSPIYGFVERGAATTFDVEYGNDVPFNDPNTPFNSTHVLFSGTATRRIFTGQLWDVEETGAMGQYVSRLKMISTNGLLLTGNTVTTQQLYTNIRIDTAIGIILDDIGWPAGKRKIGTALTTLRYWWADDKSALQALVELQITEGASAVMYIDAEDNFVFRPRDWRDTNPRSMTPQAVFGDTVFGTDPSFSSSSIPFNDPGTLFNGIPDISLYYVEEPLIRAHPEDVINSASCVVNTRQLQPLAPIWSVGADFSLGANQSQDFFPSASDPFQNAVVPVAGTDYTATNPVTPVLQALTGQQAKLTITAGPLGATVSGLQLRAQLLQTIGTTRKVTTLSPSLLADSINRHGERHYSVPIWPEIDPNVAQDLVNGLVLRYLRLRPQFTFAVVAVDQDHQNAIFALEVDDRISIINRRRNIATDVFIERIEHRVISRGVHMAVFGCEQVFQNAVARWGILGDTDNSRRFDNPLARWGF